jgi:hypothetical protein
MSLSLDSISKGRARKAPRITLLGVEKVGKSTFASQAENPIFIPMKGEQGVDELDVARFPPAQSFADVIDAIRVLYQEDHEHQTVVVDSASALEPLIWDATCRAGGVNSIEEVGKGYGKGYTEALKYWRELTEGLDALRDEKGIASIIIGHVKAKEFNDPEADPYTTYEFDINAKAASLLSRWADATLFAAFKKAIVQKNDVGFNKKVSRATGTGHRVLYTEKRPAHPGGNRYGLPFEIPLPLPPLSGWSAFRASLDAKQSPVAVAAE